KYPEVIFISVTRLFYFQTYISTFWRKCDVYRKSFSGKNIVGLGIDCIHGSVYNLSGICWYHVWLQYNHAIKAKIRRSFNRMKNYWVIPNKDASAWFIKMKDVAPLKEYMVYDKAVEAG